MKYYILKGKRIEKSKNEKANTINSSSKAKGPQCEERETG